MFKELPHDLTIERQLIASLIVDNESFIKIQDEKLVPEDFYDTKNQVLFDIILKLVKENIPVDVVTVCSRLKQMKKIDDLGGEKGIAELVASIGTTAHIASYAKIIKEQSAVRNVIRAASKATEKSFQYEGGRLDEFLSDVERDFFVATSKDRYSEIYELGNLLAENIRDLESDSRKKGQISGIPTGFIELDKKLLGLQPGQLIIVAARPGMGKTSFALNIAMSVAKRVELPVMLFSLEMEASELSLRILSSEASISSKKLKTKNFSHDELRRVMSVYSKMSQIPFSINDSPGIDIHSIKTISRKLKVQKGAVGLVIVDYLQLMEGRKARYDSRAQEVSEISRGLKELAKDLRCPVISLSQLNRTTESRPDKRPLLADLRESGSIEQDADIVLLIYRDDYYHEDSKDKGIAEILIAKNRSGETGKVRLSWQGDKSKFGNLEYRDIPHSFQ